MHVRTRGLRGRAEPGHVQGGEGEAQEQVHLAAVHAHNFLPR